MNPVLKKDVFETIENAKTEGMSESMIRELTNKIIDLFAEYDLEYGQAHKIMDCVGITLEARKQFLNP